MAASEEVLRVLLSMDATLKALLQLAQKRGAAASAGVVATDADLDGKFGDPKLKFPPRDWTGESFKDCHYSECPAALLDLVAVNNDYLARKAEETNKLTPKGQPIADFRRQDAARARGWAKRIRAGTTRTVPAHGPRNGNGHPPSGWAEEDGI